MSPECPCNSDRLILFRKVARCLKFVHITVKLYVVTTSGIKAAVRVWFVIKVEKKLVVWGCRSYGKLKLVRRFAVDVLLQRASEVVDQLQKWLEDREGLSTIPIANLTAGGFTLEVAVGDVCVWSCDTDGNSDLTFVLISI